MSWNYNHKMGAEDSLCLNIQPDVLKQQIFMVPSRASLRVPLPNSNYAVDNVLVVCFLANLISMAKINSN